MPETNLMDLMLENKLSPDAKSIARNLISIYRSSGPPNGTIELTVRTATLFMEKMPDATVSAATVVKPGENVPETSANIVSEFKRIKDLLHDLRSHLISENEQFIKPMQSKIGAMKDTLRLRQALQSGTIGPDPISIHCDQVKIAAPVNETKVDAVVLNAAQNPMDASIAEITERLKKVRAQQAQQASRAKRSTVNEETIHVRRLLIQSDNHPFKGSS